MEDELLDYDDPFKEQLRNMSIDNELAILIQSALQVGLKYYNPKKVSLGEAQTKIYDDLIEKFGESQVKEAKRASDSVLPIEYLPETYSDNLRSVMCGVFIDDKDNCIINKRILLYLQPSSFFCRDKEDIKKIMSYYSKDDNESYVSFKINELNSLKKFFNNNEEIKKNATMS